MAKGFTLIEALMVMFLASMLIYAGAISISKMTVRLELSTSASSVYSALHKARFRAIWTGRQQRVRFEKNAALIETYKEGLKSWQVEHKVRCPGVVIQANNSPTFYPQGTVSDLATIFVRNKAGAYKITVAITGRIKSTRLS